MVVGEIRQHMVAVGKGPFVKSGQRRDCTLSEICMLGRTNQVNIWTQTRGTKDL